MKTVLFTWKPERFHWSNFQQMVAAIRAGNAASMDWSCGVTRSIRPNDRFFFLRQGEEPRGIIGSGFVISEPHEGDDWDGSITKRRVYNTLRFEVLLDAAAEPILTEAELVRIYGRNRFWNPQGPGIAIPEEVAVKVEERWASLLAQTGVVPADEGFTSDYEDASDLQRQRHLAEVILRPQQAAFRAKLIDRYGTGCQISGCAVMGVVQACHVDPVADNGSDEADNGLLLRIDLHILFDANLIGVEPETLSVHIHPSLRDTEYEEFDGVALRLMEKPNSAALQRRWEAFQARLLA